MHGDIYICTTLRAVCRPPPPPITTAPSDLRFYRRRAAPHAPASARPSLAPAYLCPRCYFDAAPSIPRPRDGRHPHPSRRRDARACSAFFAASRTRDAAPLPNLLRPLRVDVVPRRPCLADSLLRPTGHPRGPHPRRLPVVLTSSLQRLLPVSLHGMDLEWWIPH
ncbi:hypothetical protein Zm00014a_013254 [Zea mays]|uniref:Uncharacterized protein n=1 Tax=Zea mays TaxID=4577 RepID=A0A317YAT6_MAIZE|nr:hypothetical protein Zm00014a_013254 [Zea mays]